MRRNGPPGGQCPGLSGAAHAPQCTWGPASSERKSGGGRPGWQVASQTKQRRSRVPPGTTQCPPRRRRCRKHTQADSCALQVHPGSPSGAQAAPPHAGTQRAPTRAPNTEQGPSESLPHQGAAEVKWECPPLISHPVSPVCPSNSRSRTGRRAGVCWRRSARLAQVSLPPSPPSLPCHLIGMDLCHSGKADGSLPVSLKNCESLEERSCWGPLQIYANNHVLDELY